MLLVVCFLCVLLGKTHLSFEGEAQILKLFSSIGGPNGVVLVCNLALVLMGFGAFPI